MSVDLTKQQQQASKLAACIAVISLVPIVAGAVLVNAPVIAVGALGAGLAAVVKLTTGQEKQKPTYTPANHPMRRAEDRKEEHVGV
jgi:hypothetical protein